MHDCLLVNQSNASQTTRPQLPVTGKVCKSTVTATLMFLVVTLHVKTTELSLKVARWSSGLDIGLATCGHGFNSRP